MRVALLVALLAVSALVAVEARSLSHLFRDRALVEAEVLANGDPLSYGFACAGVTDTSCQKNLACQKDSGTPPQPATGFICLMPGEGDGTPTPSPAQQATVATTATCKATHNVKTMGGCDCDGMCTEGFVCGLPKTAGGQNLCRPPPAVTAPPTAGGAEGDACNVNAPCGVGLCMSKAAYMCKLSGGKDVASCTTTAKSTDKLSCHSVAQLPAAPVVIPAAKTCSAKGEYTFWLGPTAAGNADPDAKGALTDGRTLFLPCCNAAPIPKPDPKLKAQYGVVIGQAAVCN